MNSEADWGWLAGIIDGEGCFWAKHYPGRVGNHVHCIIANTNLSLIQRVSTLTNVKWRPPRPSRLRRYPNYRPLYEVHLQSGALRTVLPPLLPYLTAKKQQATLALEFSQILGQRKRHGNGCNGGETAFGLDRLREIPQEILRLNQVNGRPGKKQSVSEEAPLGRYLPFVGEKEKE